MQPKSFLKLKTPFISTLTIQDIRETEGVKVQCKKCGTEMFPDSYEHPQRPVEWLMRCHKCGHFEESTQEEAFSIFKSCFEKDDS
jgi:ribosomal protein S27E